MIRIYIILLAQDVFTYKGAVSVMKLPRILSPAKFSTGAGDHGTDTAATADSRINPHLCFGP